MHPELERMEKESRDRLGEQIMCPGWADMI